MSALYRKRLIPKECICLKHDQILLKEDDKMITFWHTLHPKAEFSWGISYYVLDRGWKISYFYNSANDLVYTYCDIIDTSYDSSTDTYVFTDLLVDVIIENDGTVKILDLDELAFACEQDIADKHMLTAALRRLNDLLSVIYKNELTIYTKVLEEYSLTLS